MRVLLLSRYGPLGSTSRLRFYQYLPYLEAHGVEVTVSPLLADAYVERLYRGERQQAGFIFQAYFRRLKALLSSREFDLVWVEKEFLPFLPAFASLLMHTPYVADYDDAAFHRYDLHPQLWVRILLGRKIAAVMRRAALVVAGNDYLADYARRNGAARVEILPTVVDTDRYVPAASPRSDFRIGWIGAPVTVGYLSAIEPALRHVLDAFPDTEFRLIGARDPFSGRLPVTEISWTEATEVAELQNLDAGIMPLPDEPFERGKCGYKLIQYMGCGLPVVASPVGVNTTLVMSGVNGFLAESIPDWVAALSKLRADPGLRLRFGGAGRQIVADRYSLQAAAPRLLSLLQSVR